MANSVSSSKRRHPGTETSEITLSTEKKSKQLLSYEHLKQQIRHIRDEALPAALWDQLRCKGYLDEDGYERRVRELQTEVKSRIPPLLEPLREYAEQWSKPQPGSIVFLHFDVQSYPEHLEHHFRYFGKVIEHRSLPKEVDLPKRENLILLALFTSWTEPSDTFGILTLPRTSTFPLTVDASGYRYGVHFPLKETVRLPSCNFFTCTLQRPNRQKLNCLAQDIQVRQAQLLKVMPKLQAMLSTLQPPPQPESFAAFSYELDRLHADQVAYRQLEEDMQKPPRLSPLSTAPNIPAFCLTPNSVQPTIPHFIREAPWQKMQAVKSALEQEFDRDVTWSMFSFLYSRDVLEAAKALGIPEALCL